MIEWRECTLGDIITFQRGHDLPKKNMTGEEYPVAGSNGIIGLHNKYTTEAPAITIGRSGNVGNPYIYYENIWAHNTTLYIKEYKNSDPEFTYYLLKTMNLGDYASGSAVPTLNRNHIHTLPVKIPRDIVVQKKIASILKLFDVKIDNNEAINRNLSEQLKAIFDAWFNQMEPFGGKEPEGTQYVSIEKLCSAVTKGTTPTTLGMPFTDEGVNFIKGETILDNHGFDRTKLSYISEDTHGKLKRSQIEQGDIVFTIAGTLGRFALVDDSMTPANTNQAVAIVRAKTVTPEYLYSFFLGNWHNDYYTKRIQQAVQANLSLGTIKSLPIAVLPKKYYEQYLDIINPLICETKRIEIENFKLAELRDCLLPKLMSGELNVSDLDM